MVGGNRRLVDCYSMPVFVYFGLNRLCWIHTFYKHIYFTCICTKLLKHNSLISSHQSFMCAADSGGNTKEKKERGKKGGTAMHVSSGQDITVTRISGVGVAFIGQIRAGLCWNLLTVRVWRERNTALNENHVVGTIFFGGGGVTVRGSFSNDCKLFLRIIDGRLDGRKYILDGHVRLHFDNHALAGWQTNVPRRKISTLLSPCCSGIY